MKQPLNLTALFLAAFVLSFSLSQATAADQEDEALVLAKRVFKPLPAVMHSDENPVTPEKVELGRILFHEPRISIDGTVSCAKCHPLGLHAADGLKKSVGNNCKANPRNAPSVFNAADQISQHWIGNRKSVEDQARQSVTGPPAFGMPSNEAVEKRLGEIKGYPPLFAKAFPGDRDPVTVENLAKAIGAFERVLLTPSPLDTFLKGDARALTEPQKRGLRTFVQSGCAACHSGAYLGGQMYAKFGVIEPYEKYTKSDKPDEGRFAVTKNEADRFVFKVPILRNVAVTPPYFHDGSVEKLGEAVRIMAKVQLGRDLGAEQIEAVTAFLHSLTGPIPDSVSKTPVLPAAE